MYMYTQKLFVLVRELGGVEKHSLTTWLIALFGLARIVRYQKNSGAVWGDVGG